MAKQKKQSLDEDGFFRELALLEGKVRWFLRGRAIRTVVAERERCVLTTVHAHKTGRLLSLAQPMRAAAELGLPQQLGSRLLLAGDCETPPTTNDKSAVELRRLRARLFEVCKPGDAPEGVSS